MSTAGQAIGSICVYCGSSDAADPAWLSGAARLGRDLAAADIRLVYGGGGVGLMGACARGALSAGGRVLGVIPEFLLDREGVVPGIETVVVQSMHQRKIRMFEEADAFAVLPGAIGTLEEAIELISWRRLGLHEKPIVSSRRTSSGAGARWRRWRTWRPRCRPCRATTAWPITWRRAAESKLHATGARPLTRGPAL
jgi:uncharacterized protein (TIGR00730 family)